MSTTSIQTKVKIKQLGDWLIVRLPKEASAVLPSRGQAMVEGTINGYGFQTPLEPDGNWSHWFKLTDKVRQAIDVTDGDTVEISVVPTKNWPEPDLPADFQKSLQTTPTALATWQAATPMAHWEWVRWIRSTGNAETRQRRLEVACSKLTAGERRPCCWNRNLCTEPAVSKNGVLLDAI